MPLDPRWAGEPPAPPVAARPQHPRDPASPIGGGDSTEHRKTKSEVPVRTELPAPHPGLPYIVMGSPAQVDSSAKSRKGLLFAGLLPSKEKSSLPESTDSPPKVLSYEDWGFGADSAGERAAVLSGRAEGSALSLNGRQRKQPTLDLPGRGGGAAGAKTWHGFVWASGMGCPAIRPCCPLPSARTGPAVRETRPRRTVLRSSASRRARVRVPRRARLPAPPPTSRIKRGLYSGSTLDNDSIALTTLSSARWEASPGVQPPTCGGRTRPPPGGHRDKVNDSANIRATV